MDMKLYILLFYAPLSILNIMPTVVSKFDVKDMSNGYTASTVCLLF